MFIDPEENLSNGDEVTLSFNNESIDIENYYKVKIKNDNKKVKVDGLKEVAEIDPSDYYEVEVEGISPNASLKIVKKEDAPEYFDLVTADVDKKDHLFSGDEVTIKFNYDEDRLINEYGVVISPESIKVPIDGIASYISSYDELSDSDKKEIEEEADYQVDEQARDWTDADLTNKNLIGTVTVSPKQEDGSWGSSGNHLYLIYEITANENIPEKNYNYDFSYYNFVKFDDVLNSEDDQLYDDANINKKNLRHRAQIKPGEKQIIYYPGYYFMEQLMDKIYGDYNHESYDYDLSFNLDDYRVKTDGVAND